MNALPPHPPAQLRPAPRLMTQVSQRRRTAPSARQLVLRRLTLVGVKLALPLLALLLLTSVAFWPEIVRLTGQTRISLRRIFTLEAQTGRMLQPHYQGIDQKGRPYTVTADWATEPEPGRIILGEPKGDMVTESGTWVMVQSHDGVYMQRTGLLDLSNDVILYRDDGTVLRTQTAEADVKQGAASSNDMTHAEGPFGVIDAQGFMLTDKGAAIQFQGPAKLIINGGDKK